MNRRDFIKTASASVASISPLARIGGALSVGSVLNASRTFSDGYKALVVVFLDGGNDSMNMFIPTVTAQHDQYKAIRGEDVDGMAVANTNLDDATLTITNGHYIKNDGTNHPYYDAPLGDDGLSDSAIRSYRKGSYHTTNTSDSSVGGLGINSMMPELAAMYKSGKVSLVSNVGTLVQPTTKAQITDGSAQLPVFLFAHNHQKRAVYTAQAEQLGATGWAGKIADAWNVNDPVGLNLSYGDVNRLLIGRSTSPLKMPTSTPVSFETAYNEPRIKGDIFESILNRFNSISNNNAFSTYYANKVKKAGDLSTTLVNGMTNAPDFSTFTAKNSYGQTLFTHEIDGGDFMEDSVNLHLHDEIRDDIFKQFEAAAKMIKVGRDNLGHTRQIIYIRMPGYDSHSGQTTNHLNNLRSLSLAASDFQKALEEMSLDDEVMTISLSDFGRTLKNNSDGTDHGWGGHNFIMTGATGFQGGNVLGSVMTDLALDGVNTHTEKGRIIPTTSIEQMIAPCLKWFGVDDSLMSSVLPNLVNFRTDNSDSESAFLQGMFA